MFLQEFQSFLDNRLEEDNIVVTEDFNIQFVVPSDPDAQRICSPRRGQHYVSPPLSHFEGVTQICAMLADLL